MYAVTPFAVQCKTTHRNNFFRELNNLFQFSNQIAGFSYTSEGLSVLERSVIMLSFRDKLNARDPETIRNITASTGFLTIPTLKSASIWLMPF